MNTRLLSVGKILIVVSIASATAFFIVESLMTRRHMESLCRIDGGLKIYKHISADSLLDTTDPDPLYCASCVERLAKRQYNYVDVLIPASAGALSSGAVQPGYYRLRLGSAGDPTCRAWGGFVSETRYRNIERNNGLTDSQCIAVERLVDVPEEPKLSASRGSDGGVSWLLHSVIMTRSGTPIASYRDYWYTPKYRWIFAIDSGFPQPAGYCESGVQRMSNLEKVSGEALGAPALN